VVNSGANAQPAAIQALFNKAVTAQAQGNHEGVVTRLKKILKQIPDQPQVLNMCAHSLAELGEFKAAMDMLQKAIKSSPGFLDSWINLGVVQQKTGDFEAAAHSYDRFCKLNPGSAIGYMNFANVCQLLKRFDEAVSAYDRALTIVPDNVGVWSNLSRASLHTGNWEKSLNAADQTLTLNPGHTGAMAIKSVALAELGRGAEVAALVDFDRLIEKREFDAPAGFADLADFNDALCAHCLNHPSLVFEPSDNTTMQGHQTGILSHDKDMGPIGPLLELIDAAVRDYQSSHPIDGSHPFLAQQPTRWNYDIWGTVLGAQGHQAPHIHRSGWLSGCYYAKIPDAINADGDDQAGWIEFGRPQDHPLSKAPPVVRSYQPHEGMVVLFPSYFYHRTEPFVSQEKRISIAFDILPVA